MRLSSIGARYDVSAFSWSRTYVAALTADMLRRNDGWRITGSAAPSRTAARTLSVSTSSVT
jgi:hypothetical protein